MNPLGILASTGSPPALTKVLVYTDQNQINYTVPAGYNRASIWLLGGGSAGNIVYEYADPNDSNGDGNYENTGNMFKTGGSGGNMRWALNRTVAEGQIIQYTVQRSDQSVGYNQACSATLNGSLLMYTGWRGNSVAGSGGDGYTQGGSGGNGYNEDAWGGGAAGSIGNGGNGGKRSAYSSGPSLAGARGAGSAFTDSVSLITYQNGNGNELYGGGGNAIGGFYDASQGQIGFMAIILTAV